MSWEQLLNGNLNRQFLGNPLEEWLTAGLLTAGLFALAVTVRAFALSRFRRSALLARVDQIVPELIQRTLIFFLFVVAMHFGTQNLELPVRIDHARDNISLFVFFLQLGLWLTRALGYYGRRLIQDAQARDAGRATTLSTLITLGNILIWLTMGLLLLENYGKNVSALITGLGVGGVAVAFALQSILGDLFASFSILLDKPFTVGDAISVNGVTGTVEQIGLKTTRIRSVSGEQLIYSNADLLKNVLRNFKRMDRRRVVFTFGVVYETPPAKLHRVRELVQSAVQSQLKTTFERCHLASFAASSLDFESVYWVEAADYNTYVDMHHNIAVALVESFQREGIEFAYPTQVQIERKPS